MNKLILFLFLLSLSLSQSLHQEVHCLNLKLMVHTKTNEAFEEELRLVKTELETAFELKMDLLKEVSKGVG